MPDNNKPKKKAWPTKQAMEQVYKMKLWGNNDTSFYSGEGSHHPEIVNPYLKIVSAFLQSFNQKLVVCDLGCGDFNIGKQLIKHTQNYIGIDIVAALIAHNKANFKANHLEFKCLDIATDKLPKADCVILRQVLQHLSNTEIQNILPKLTQYKYLILTEHIPEGDFNPNTDIISGQGTRLKKQSGINLLASPFNIKIKDKNEVLRVNLNNSKGIIVTTIYTLN